MKSILTKNYSKEPLGALASVRSGYNFRGRIEPDPLGGICVVQTKDITNEGILDMGALVSVMLADLKDELFIREGDILLRSRGGANFPAAVVPKTQVKAVAAFPILLLRKNGQAVLPEYLAWQLNQPRTQNILQSLAQSTFIPTLSKSSLLDIQIPLPPLEVQHRISAFSQLVERESQLFQAISAKRQILTNRLLLRYAEDGKLPSEIAQLFWHLS
jgi:restriction endonuclease S subunit